MGWQGYGHVFTLWGVVAPANTVVGVDVRAIGGHSSDVTAPNRSGLYREKGLLPICRIMYVKPGR